jgi:hypothetical protein
MRRLFLAFSFVVGCSAARAEFTGHDLEDACSLYPQHAETTAMCMGYIAGTLDMVRGFDKTFKVRTACEPPGVTGDQLIKMTIKYLRDHPAQLHFTAASLIWNMYTETFPCNGNSN